LTRGTVLVGSFLGAAVALPASFGLISIGLWVLTIALAARLIVQHYIINFRATDQAPRFLIGRRWALVRGALSTAGVAFCGISGLSGLTGIVGPALDRKIDYLQTSKAAQKAVKAYDQAA
jgi:hypothetical protein